MAQQRRYERVGSTDRPHIAVTERDMQILEAVAAYRLLRSRHIHCLFPAASRQHLTRRLRLLYDHRYLSRVHEPWYQGVEPGSKGIIVGLGDRGAEVLADESEGHRRPQWEEKNAHIGLRYILHTLSIADVLVPLSMACRTTPGVVYTPREALLPQDPLNGSPPPMPNKWRVSVRVENQLREVSVIPDGLFALTVPNMKDADGGKRADYYFLEADLGTEPIERHAGAFHRQSSIARKIVAYGEGYKRGVHTQLYQIPDFRVLFVTTSKTRRDSILEEVAYLCPLSKIEPSLFWVTDFDTLRSDSILTEPFWTYEQQEEESGKQTPTPETADGDVSEAKAPSTLAAESAREASGSTDRNKRGEQQGSASEASDLVANAVKKRDARSDAGVGRNNKSKRTPYRR